MTTRHILSTDYPLLEEFLYHAVFVPPGEPLPSRDVIFDSNVYIYIKDFGICEHDAGIVAEIGGKPVGAAWVRIIPAYGNIDDKTPELAISLLPEYRGHGVGAALMQHLFVLLKEKGYTRTSLSVQKNNPAARFYQRLGYEIISEKVEDYIMVKQL